MMLSLFCANVATAQSWQPVGDRIRTPWAEQVDPAKPLPEYPRPLMQRSEWLNLNGLWDYAVVPAGTPTFQKQGRILVPFCIESSLSGVGCTVGKDNVLWYRRTFTVPKAWKGQRVLLHFGAVDWQADIWVNDIKAGSHTGGYTPFTLDITEALKAGENTLSVKVWDGTDTGFQPRGKQVSKPGGIWYTSVTGIWQTVWLEPVPQQYIAGLRITPDLTAGCFRVLAEGHVFPQPAFHPPALVIVAAGAFQVVFIPVLKAVHIEGPEIYPNGIEVLDELAVCHIASSAFSVMMNLNASIK